MKRKEAIERLCVLITDVGTEVFHNQHPHDCICGAKVVGEPIVDEKIIAFIENAVKNALSNFYKEDRDSWLHD